MAAFWKTLIQKKKKNAEDVAMSWHFRKHDTPFEVDNWYLAVIFIELQSLTLTFKIASDKYSLNLLDTTAAIARRCIFGRSQ